MPDSILKQLVDEMVTTIGAINGSSGGYNYDLTDGTRVFIYGRDPDNIPSPGVVLLQVGEEKDHTRSFDLVDCRATFLAVCHLLEGDVAEAPDAVRDLYHDIEKALRQDHTRGALATDSNVLGMEGVPTMDGLPHILFAIEIEIIYRHRIKDPAAT